MKKIITPCGQYFLMSLLSLILLPGCGKNGVFKKSGTMKSEFRILPAIDEIFVYDKVNIILTQDSVQQVKVEAGENLLADIETSASGNSVTIRDNNDYKWLRDLDSKVNVFISVKALRKIFYDGAGEVRSTNLLTADTFSIDSRTGIGSINIKLQSKWSEIIIRKAASDIVLEGASVYTQIYCADQGALDLSNFAVDYLVIDQRSVRDSYINVTRGLTARILFKGNLFYKGTPAAIELFMNDDGRLYKMR